MRGPTRTGQLRADRLRPSLLQLLLLQLLLRQLHPPHAEAQTVWPAGLRPWAVQRPSEEWGRCIIIVLMMIKKKTNNSELWRLADIKATLDAAFRDSVHTLKTQRLHRSQVYNLKREGAFTLLHFSSGGLRDCDTLLYRHNHCFFFSTDKKLYFLITLFIFLKLFDNKR